MHNHKEESFLTKIVSSVAGPVQSIVDFYHFIRDKLHVSDKALFNATAYNFSSALGLTVANLYFKSSFNDNWIELCNKVQGGDIPNDWSGLLVNSLSYGSMMKASELGVDYFEGRAAANVKVLAHSNFKAAEGVSSESKTQVVHNLNKLIDHNTHYVFENLTSFYTFCSGLHSIYKLGMISYAPTFIAGSLICNIIVEQLNHSNLHSAKEGYHDENKHLQDNVNKDISNNENGLVDFKNAALNVSLWESIQDKAHHFVEGYLSPAMQIVFCVAAKKNGFNGEMSQLWDSLENISSPFIHHLEHGDDVTDDHVYMEALGKVLVNPIENNVAAEAA